jgi:cytochrome c oxidase subunit 3
MAFSFTRALNVAEFQQAAHETEIVYGATNTFALVTSSLAMTIAVRAANIGNRRLCATLLGATATLGFIFLVIKGLEYRDDLKHHLYPTLHFALGHNAAQIFWAFS